MKFLRDLFGRPSFDKAGFDRAWAFREDELYPRLFGPESNGIFVLTADTFHRLGRDKVDPRWLFQGVFEYAPTADRASWVYVTSGLSTDWEGRGGGWSGLGMELLLETAGQSPWAITALSQLLAYTILLNAGQLGPSRRLKANARIPLGGPINGNAASLIRHAIAVVPRIVPGPFELPSGKAEFLQFAGVTETEMALAGEAGLPTVVARLDEAGLGFVIDPARPAYV